MTHFEGVEQSKPVRVVVRQTQNDDVLRARTHVVIRILSHITQYEYDEY